jgi:hypothetical protein
MPDLCKRMCISKVAFCLQSSSTCLQCITPSRHSIVFEKNCLSTTSYRNGLPTTLYVHIWNQLLKLNTDAKVVVDRLGSEHLVPLFCISFFHYMSAVCHMRGCYGIHHSVSFGQDSTYSWATALCCTICERRGYLCIAGSALRKALDSCVKTTLSCLMEVGLTRTT